MGVNRIGKYCCYPVLSRKPLGKPIGGGSRSDSFWYYKKRNRIHIVFL